MGTTPDQLRTDVEYRRAHLARNVDLLADKMTPRRMAQRRVSSMRRGLTGAKERVMGTAHESAQGLAEGTGQAAENMADTAREAVGDMAETLQQAPERAKRQTQGSPLAAGLIAFGAGLLAGGLLPATEAEERAGRQLREHGQELLEPVKQTVMEAAQDVGDELRGPAAEAVESVKSAAQEAVSTTQEQVKDAGAETAEGLRRTGRETADQAKAATGGDAGGSPGGAAPDEGRGAEGSPGYMT
ncbi:hypothetical protein GCM10010347_33800 [Streptomyces cirratus]|uniref:DUF3618 domain-containing protein n=1 Tax=Streptomyces cirratus TaxID=68187 RepID=A0ABQ3EU70_9ACTN|nr:DUF3618 domain-containing protein [Streptomyces cirratus]GHB60960.1 hypothetical protein GCM10010347_33800 [Streptomyces cirratus]